MKAITKTKTLLLAMALALVATFSMLTAAPGDAFAKNSGGTVTVYRVYNAKSGEHLFTKDNAEKTRLVKAGWKSEGVAFYAPGKSSQPVYRLYNNRTGEHLFTKSKAEHTKLLKQTYSKKSGKKTVKAKTWKSEGIAFYASDTKSVAVMKVVNPKASAKAKTTYTVSAAEKSKLVKAKWQYKGVAWYGVKTPTYTVKFNANGGTGTMKAQTVKRDAATVLTKNAFKRSGWTFQGWAKTKNGSVAYKNAAKVTNAGGIGKTVTLYAVWKKNPTTYTVKFDANGGTGSMAAQTFTRGKATTLAKNTFTRSGYTFQGWSKTKAGGVAYKNAVSVKDLVAAGKSVTLYAVWKKNASTSTSTSNSTTPKPSTQVLTTGGSTTKYTYQIILPNGDSNVYVDTYFPVLVKTNDPSWKQDKLALRGWDSGSISFDAGDYCDVRYTLVNGAVNVTELGTQTDAGFLSRRLYSKAGVRELRVEKDGKTVATKKVTVKDANTLNAERRAFLDKKVVELGIDRLGSEYDKVNAVWDYGFSKFSYHTIYKDSNGWTQAMPRLSEDIPWPFNGRLNCSEGSAMAQYMLKKVGVKSELEYGGYLAHVNLKVTFSNGETWTIDPSPAACTTDVSKVAKTALDKWK